MKARFNQEVVAHADQTVVVEGNHYFPPESLHREFFIPSDQTSVCPWKGTAQYYHISVDGITTENAAWYYADPHPEAEEIRDQVAFWKAVDVDEN